MKRILITSVGTATAVNLIKYFHKLGDYIVGTDINAYGYTAGSMLVDEFVRVSLANTEGYLDEIQQIIEDKMIDIFIPVNDIEVYVVALGKEKIKCKCVIPKSNVIEAVRDKYICSNILRETGVTVPQIVKADYKGKRILRDRIGVGSKGILMLEENDITPQYNLSDKFLQRYVEGEEYTVDVLTDQEGKPVYIVPRKRLEVKSGVATKVYIEKNEKLISYVEKILQKVCLPGFSNIQFIKDEQENYWFIEINYRFAGAGASTLAVSKDYLETFKKIADGKPVSLPLNKDVKWNSVVTRYYEEVVYEEGIS